ncbi:riboflavin synthase domain-like protein [Coemansia reversa NRRL 1564]|uniref:Riboflavin synthase domain-like protein n=1 Tax=Coemansia reversa (strain ATCC 12441 / NRRL 1564) TaxID=763665 RepID=A0A2G5B9J9_COERN|nr:riboflavin synthase domain-like protein [Coemansia reversa NRRL 1564]|eukprot:PIA15693.1 riboflavin synthase domain-like protein [Coemansia reversa NRRL 1564]
MPSYTVLQPLLLDFRPMAELSAISGAPRVPSPVCTASYANTEEASDDYRPSKAAINSNFAHPPWYGELTDVDSSKEESSQTPFLATIISAKRMTTASALKRTLLLELELPDTVAAHMQGNWYAGDAFNIFAPNDECLVAALIKRLGVDARDADRPILLQKKDPEIGLPAHLQRFTSTSATLRNILTWTVDICSVPRKQFIRVLSDHCTEATDRDRLLYLCSRQGAKLFEELRRQSPTVLDILHAFPSCTLPYTRLIELLSPLVPRSYSICNAPCDKANIWRIAFNVVEYELEVVDPFASVEDDNHTTANSTKVDGTSTSPIRINRKGICTPWLEKLSHTAEKQQILVVKRPNLNGFYLPPSLPSHGLDPRPVIMVGPGTGVAPFIGFLEQRANEIEKTQVYSTHEHPLTWLFFGCRSSTDDYLFRDQIEHHLDNKALSRLSMCFSRDPAAREKMGASKYVQDSMLQHGNEIANLMLNQNALLYVCGDAKGMGKDVNEAMASILCRYLNEHPENIERIVEELPKSKVPVDSDAKQMSRIQALQLLMQWSSQKRYIRDLWA